MAFYSKLNNSQIAKIKTETRLNITKIEGIEAGTNNSNYRIFVDGNDEPEYVLKILESPDRHANGQHHERTELLAKVLDHMRQRSEAQSPSGVPTPVIFTDENNIETPYIKLQFPHATEKGTMVTKTAILVPFVRGKNIEYDGRSLDAETCKTLGAGWAGWQNLAEEFPEAAKMDNPFDPKKWNGFAAEMTADLEADHDEKETITATSSIASKLAYVMAKERENGKLSYPEDVPDPISWEEYAGTIIEQCCLEARTIAGNYLKIADQFPQVVNNGDTYADNCVILPDGRIISIDNGAAHIGPNTDLPMHIMATSCDASTGQINWESAAAALEGWESQRAVDPIEKENMQLMCEVAEARWMLSRLYGIFKATSEKDLDAMRSPEGKLNNIATLQQSAEQFAALFAPQTSLSEPANDVAVDTRPTGRTKTED